jgi:hypothetical protein
MFKVTVAVVPFPPIKLPEVGTTDMIEIGG